MNRDILSKIEKEQMISREELGELLTTTDQELIEELYRRARATAGKYYGKEIYLRGLIEFTNYCKNNCYYCGIRCGNEKAQRYRLTMDQILSCCESGWELGFRTFVLQEEKILIIPMSGSVRSQKKSRNDIRTVR